MALDYRRIDKDPIIDIIRSEAQHNYGHNLSPEALGKISDKSGVSTQTLRNWFFGETQRPQNLTTRFVLEALDCKVQVVRSDGTVIKGPRKK